MGTECGVEIGGSPLATSLLSLDFVFFYLILYVTGIVCDFETLCDTLYRLTVFINCVFE